MLAGDHDAVNDQAGPLPSPKYPTLVVDRMLKGAKRLT